MSSVRHGLYSWTIGAALWSAAASTAGAGALARDGIDTPPLDASRADAGADGVLLRDALPCLKSILERARFGASKYEAAAWLTLAGEAGAGLSCVPWPASDESALARWSGPRPRGLLAQVHSHPTRPVAGRISTPRPSRNDCEVARRLGVPVLTVSLDGVYECRPEDGRISLLLRAGWERKPAVELAAGARLVRAERHTRAFTGATSVHRSAPSRRASESLGSPLPAQAAVRGAPRTDAVSP